MSQSDLTFGDVLSGLHEGKSYRRSDWGQRRIYLVPGSTFSTPRPPLSDHVGEGAEVYYKPHIDMLGLFNVAAVWNPTTDDVLATDWEEV
jgi:hypothetical protein